MSIERIKTKNSTFSFRHLERKLEVSLTHSDLPLTLSLKDKPKMAIACGETFKPRIYFSSSEDLSFNLNYIAFSKGRIAVSGSKSVSTRSKSRSALYQTGDRRELSAFQSVSPGFSVSSIVFLLSSSGIWTSEKREKDFLRGAESEHRLHGITKLEAGGVC